MHLIGMEYCTVLYNNPSTAIPYFTMDVFFRRTTVTSSQREPENSLENCVPISFVQVPEEMYARRGNLETEDKYRN